MTKNKKSKFNFFKNIFKYSIRLFVISKMLGIALPIGLGMGKTQRRRGFGFLPRRNRMENSLFRVDMRKSLF